MSTAVERAIAEAAGQLPCLPQTTPWGVGAPASLVLYPGEHNHVPQPETVALGVIVVVLLLLLCSVIVAGRPTQQGEAKQPHPGQNRWLIFTTP